MSTGPSQIHFEPSEDSDDFIVHKIVGLRIIRWFVFPKAEISERPDCSLFDFISTDQFISWSSKEITKMLSKDAKSVIMLYRSSWRVSSCTLMGLL